MQKDVRMKVEQSIEARLTRAQQLLNDLSAEHVRDEAGTKATTVTLETMVPDVCVNHIPMLTGDVGRDQLSEFYSTHFIPKMPSETEIAPISRILSAQRLLDDEQPSIEEAPSDPDRVTSAPPSRQCD
jgi:hypothetical protein